MKKIIFLILMGLTGQDCYAQNASNAFTNWKMAPIHIKTRWATVVSPNNALTEYPRPQMVRSNWTNLNGLWNYAITEKDVLPPQIFEGNILVPYPLESALSGVQKNLQPTQNLWYRRSFQKPTTRVGDRVLLHFGAVDWQTIVFLNGSEVCTHSGGYQNFSADITDFVKEGSNELLVKVYDPTDQGIGPHGKQVLNPGSIYYTPSSGIWQTVWLEIVPIFFIESLSIVPNLDSSLFSITINTNKNEKDLSTEVVVRSNRKTTDVDRSGKPNVEQRIPMPNPHLWSPDDPFLYDLIVRLKSKGKIIDEVKSYFGMRKVDIQRDENGIERIYLNNRYTFNLGLLDQGFWPEGLYTAPTDSALEFDIKAAKLMGFNTIRKHIKIEPARWYYHCDKLGMLVWQDMVNPNQGLPRGAKEEFEKEVAATVKQLQNHPCITTWVLFNERWGAYDQERLTRWLKDIDPSRLVNGHSGELLYVNGALRSPSPNPWIGADLTDVHSYPDPMEAPAIKGKARVLGEFGGIGVSIPGHEWNDLQGWGYIQVTPKNFKGKYDIMMRRLKKLEKEGLSGSIYTQPTDVEGEENGLLTYDREVIKIPLAELREINATIVPQPKLQGVIARIAKEADNSDADAEYESYLDRIAAGEYDSSVIRRCIVMAIRKKDQSNLTKLGHYYFNKLTDVFSKENLKFFQQTTRTSKDVGFNLFFKNPDRVNQVLGQDAAEGKIREIIAEEEIQPNLASRDIKPNWEAMRQNVTEKYGELGEEVMLGRCMLYHWTVSQNWDSLGKYYVLYFTRALSHSEYHINNVSWAIFDHVNNPKILEFAVSVMKYNLENFDQKNVQAYDTYANLLYKIGRTREAFEWEQKAVNLSEGDSEIADNFKKMKQGVPTWLDK